MKFKIRSLLRKQGIKAKKQSLLPFHRDMFHGPREYQNALDTVLAYNLCHAAIYFKSYLGHLSFLMHINAVLKVVGFFV